MRGPARRGQYGQQRRLHPARAGSGGASRQARDYDGVRLRVRGNGESYNLHLRTSDLWLPWQSYRASFVAAPEWTWVELPFADFAPHRMSKAFDSRRLSRIGVVAIGRDFTAEVCVNSLGFYRARRD